MSTIIYAGKHTLTYSVQKHSHKTWEFIYCTGGSGTITFEGGGKFSYQEGNVIGIPPNVVHTNNSSDGFTNIHLNIQDTGLYHRTPILFMDDRNHYVKNAFVAAFYHYKEGARDNASLLKAYGYLITAYVGTYYKERFLNETVEEIKNSIIHNYADCNYELDKYLASQPFSIDYLRKLFKNELGVTPHQYLSDLRLKTAAEWLCSLGKEANMTEVSRLCGFREPLYFSRMFKKKYGVAPTFYLAAQEALQESVTETNVKVFPPSADV